MAEHQTPLLLKLKVLDSEKVIFTGEVVSLSSVNEKGDFDVLEMHANFITLIEKRLIMRTQSSEEKVLELERGIMKVNKDVVTVFVGMNMFGSHELSTKKVDKKSEISKSE
jgi:F-type H+-transporting ATPase subunit epsilon